MAEQRFPIQGNLDYATADALRTELSTFVAATDYDIVVDCAGLIFIDSAGVSVFVLTQRSLGRQGRTLRVENLNRTCRRVFDILGLTEMLGIKDLDPA